MELVTWPNPILREKCKSLSGITEEVRQNIKKMFDIMYKHDGVGLSAPQVGWPVRLFVMEEGFVCINPKVTLSFPHPTRSQVVEAMEGCLSLPGEIYKIKRAPAVHIEYIDILNNSKRHIFHTLDGSQFYRVVQHENDHLDGILIRDRYLDDYHKPSSG